MGVGFLYLPFPGCLKRVLKGVDLGCLLINKKFARDCGCGLPLGSREDKLIGGGMLRLAALGLRRTSFTPFIWIALSAGDCP